MIVDLFAGCGGWDEGLRHLTDEDAVGIEINKYACATRKQAGHATIRADVSTYPLSPFYGRVSGLVASPPCQAFSAAGRRGGLQDLRGQLVFEVIRWVSAIQPKWVACEQVKEVLPIWKLFAAEMSTWGYHVWYGVLNAADYGVPQTRQRAILLAAQEPFTAPEPTHAENPSDDIFGTSLAKWITMAEALGWPDYYEIDSNAHRGEGIRQRHGERPTDPATLPAPTITTKARCWKVDTSDDASESLLPPEGSRIRGGLPTKHHKPTERELDQPAPTLAFGNDAAGWAWERPATTVVGSFQPQMIAAPGWRTDPKVPRQDAEGSIPVSVRQAGVLQTFPHDYPWQGSRTSRFQQVGNAIPPLLAYHLVKRLLEVTP